MLREGLTGILAVLKCTLLLCIGALALDRAISALRAYTDLSSTGVVLVLLAVKVVLKMAAERERLQPITQELSLQHQLTKPELQATESATTAGLEAKRPVAKSVKGFAKALQGFLNFPTSLTYDRMIRGTTYSSFEGAVQKLQKTHSHKPGKVVMLVLADPLAYLAALLSIFGHATLYAIT